MNRSRVIGTPPKVFVIVLTWNNFSDTLECLRSLEGLEYQSYQTVVVDNGSEDNTARIVRETFPNVVIIENERNLGYAEGNNIGIQFSLEQGAEFVLVLNNDTIVDPALLQVLTFTAQARPQVGIFSPRIYWYSSPNVIWFDGARWNPEIAQFSIPHSGEKDDGLTAPDETDYASGCALFFRAEVPAKVGLFDRRFFLMWEEADWCYRARRQGYQITMEPKAKVWHKVSRTFGEECQGPGCRYYYERNRWLWIEKNLTGYERRRAFQRCLREAYWSLLYLFQLDPTPVEKAVIKAKLLGSLHYMMRRFGEGPALSS